MKKLFLFILLTAGILQAQKVATIKDVLRDTLTAGRYETIKLTYDIFPHYSVILWTTSGTDTIKVSTVSKFIFGQTDVYTLKSVVDLSNSSPIDMSTGIIVTTTPKEYYIYDPKVFGVKIAKNGLGATTTIFILQGKADDRN